MRRFALIACLVACPAAAEPWQPLTEPEVQAALTSKALRYSSETVQDFRASGRTLYTHKGHESWGYWAVRDDQYCSQWPPNSLWECYNIARSGNRIRFIGRSGDITDGAYVD